MAKPWSDRLPERLVIHSSTRTTYQTQKVILHSFNVGDSDDPLSSAYTPIHKWQDTEKGQWCMDNCEGEIVFFSMTDPFGWGYKIVLQGELSEQNLTFFKLKWPE